jgi:hypothetical protein
MFRQEPAHQPAEKNLFSVAHWSLIFLPLLVFLNGTSPYLGLKTEYSFAMFSNLRTEGGVSNHWIVPASTQIFDYQKDMVEIVRSSDPKLQRAANNKQLLVFFRFKNYVAGVKPQFISYIRNGKQYEFRRATAVKSDELMQKSSILELKLLRFRNISKYDPEPCAH